MKIGQTASLSVVIYGIIQHDQTKKNPHRRSEGMENRWLGESKKKKKSLNPEWDSLEQDG